MKQHESLRFDRFDTPIGPLTVARDEFGLRHILFPENRYPPEGIEAWIHDPVTLSDARGQLQDYFAGRRQEFTLALHPVGTDFQKTVWRALAGLPFGRTCSYADLARAIGKPAAVRAVGAANGRNPLPIVLPCHRVIGADGQLTGFGGGLPLKQWLLSHEGIGQGALSF
ncbi:methylated-DNA--[protein]-cysteine S-methyltransferase [Arenimonas sp. MALMAid1274]|uniref:methylated-DNA--[protein]-cysteine S-methyltransferase n=1 Tax=Arenimonas sp. MALMAid1274 TaxID=3411630 RepID=UPI003BA38892